MWPRVNILGSEIEVNVTIVHMDVKLSLEGGCRRVGCVTCTSRGSQPGLRSQSGGAEVSWEVLLPKGTACGVLVKEDEEARVAGSDSLRGGKWRPHYVETWRPNKELCVQSNEKGGRRWD